MLINTGHQVISKQNTPNARAAHNNRSVTNTSQEVSIMNAFLKTG
jgi:hypothetical protein